MGYLQKTGSSSSEPVYPRGYNHPPPLENRNSAPEIVVLSPGRETATLATLPIPEETLPLTQQQQQKTTRGRSRVSCNRFLVGPLFFFPGPPTHY